MLSIVVGANVIVVVNVVVNVMGASVVVRVAVGVVVNVLVDVVVGVVGGAVFAVIGAGDGVLEVDVGSERVGASGGAEDCANAMDVVSGTAQKLEACVVLCCSGNAAFATLVSRGTVVLPPP